MYSEIMILIICEILFGVLEGVTGIPIFLEADSRLTLLGESVVDLLEILCLVGLIGRPTA